MSGLISRLRRKTRHAQQLKKINFNDCRPALLPQALLSSTYWRLFSRGQWRKLFNFTRAEVSRFLGSENCGGRPYFLSVEPVNYCNLKCPLCSIGYLPSRDTLDFGLYKRMLEQLGPYVARMELYKRGEPLLHPQIIPMLELAASYGIETTVATNLNVLPAGGARALAKSGVNVLIVSLDGATQETYQKYRVGGRLETVLENTRELARARKELGRKTPFILMQYVVFRHNEHELDEAVKLARDCGADQLMFKPAFIPDDKKEMEAWAPLNREFVPGSGHIVEDGSCAWPWGGLNVFADATVSLCYVDEKCRWPLKDMLDSGFRDWNGALERAARRAIISRETGNCGACGDAPCGACRAFGRTNFWI
ncbi:MAG: radical SAM protein [Elusimicrobia bacterium]|nr:radical SAM protein [Elusimicrobiota bacterium]